MDYYPKKLKLDEFNEKITDNIMSGNIKVLMNSPKKPKKKSEKVIDQTKQIETHPEVLDKKKDSIFLKTMNNLMAE